MIFEGFWRLPRTLACPCEVYGSSQLRRGRTVKLGECSDTQWRVTTPSALQQIFAQFAIVFEEKFAAVQQTRLGSLRAATNDTGYLHYLLTACSGSISWSGHFMLTVASKICDFSTKNVAKKRRFTASLMWYVSRGPRTIQAARKGAR